MRPEAGPESLRKRASFSKAPSRCPASRGVFPALRTGKKRESRAAIPRLFQNSDAVEYPAAKAALDRPGCRDHVLDRRPQPFLIGVKFQSGMDCSNPSVGKSGTVFRIHLHVPHVLVKPRTVLGVDRGRAGDG